MIWDLFEEQIQCKSFSFFSHCLPDQTIFLILHKAYHEKNNQSFKLKQLCGQALAIPSH